VTQPSTSTDLAELATATEIGELYTRLAAPLERIVRRDIRAPEPVIEDACQFAWSRLVHHAGHVHREAVLAWLARTAIREAFKLIRRADRELSLEETIALSSATLEPSRALGPEELSVCRDRLDSIRSLPERQQRLLWLHLLGLSYAEIASRTGYSERTVERQLLRAKRAVRAAAAA
jgi:RNA polymerase sigma factor (sigma-70 family)